MSRSSLAFLLALTSCSRTVEGPGDGGAKALILPVDFDIEASKDPLAFTLVATSSSSACASNQLELSTRVQGEALRVKVAGFVAQKPPCERRVVRTQVALDSKWLEQQAQRVTVEVGETSDSWVFCAESDRVLLDADGPEIRGAPAELLSRVSKCVGADDQASALVSIVTSPPGATVTLGDRSATTPFVGNIETNADALPLKVTLEGYETWNGVLRRNETGHFAAEIRLTQIDEDAAPEP